jgi:hypothetical protein
MEKRLEIAKMLNNTDILWQNNWETQDMKKFVGWGWWIGIRYISQNEITNFVSWECTEISLNLLWWEGESTKVIYDISSKSWKVKLKWKKYIEIDRTKYYISINDKMQLILNPIEEGRKIRKNVTSTSTKTQNTNNNTNEKNWTDKNQKEKKEEKKESNTDA